MIEYTTGNLLDADTQALVNTVNTVGVMGKGIALQFKHAFPENYKRYVEACKRGELTPGKLLVAHEHTTHGDRVIINFPTKTEYYRKSSYGYIEAGLKALVQAIGEQGIQSIALPPLGCGHGGLRWDKVKPMIEAHLGGLSVRVVVYEPSEAVKEVLRKELVKESHLTPARAMVMYAMYDYERMGEPASLFVANKLSFFLQLMGEPLRLQFVPHHYGPYAPQVAHVLYALNGKYLSGMEQKDAKPFEPLMLNYDRQQEVVEWIARELKPAQRLRLDRLVDLMADFRSAYALELLSSVAFLHTQDPSLNVEGIIERMCEWSERKEAMADEHNVRLSLEHILVYGNTLEIM